MAKKHGKVKAIPVKEVTEGMQVMDHLGNIAKTINWYSPDGILIIWEISVKCRDGVTRNNSVAKSDLKTLVVEYNITEGVDDFGTTNMKQLPLKYSQWQSALDNKEVDTNKIVEFETIHANTLMVNCQNPDSCRISDHCGCNSSNKLEYAKIIPSRADKTIKMSPSEFDIAIARAYNAGKQAMLDQKDGQPFRSSVEYFKNEFPEIFKSL